MTGVSAQEFSDFFRAVHGFPPFPWQRRLAEMVCASGWPQDPLDVPTGAGKTAAIDVALFHLAVEATLGQERSAPVRIAFVVDRRLVVDDAYRRATRIARALSAARDGVLFRMAASLGALAEDPERPLLCARLRGGTPRDPDWVRTPAQPTVVVSTVDQVGSRLLFRGYGVSSSMRPVHAGLLGTDTLVLLDEAHLSGAFVDTVEALGLGRDLGANPGVRARWRHVTLSATPRSSTSTRSATLMRDDDRADGVLGPRLRASKPAMLVTARDTEPALFAEHAWSLSTLGGGGGNVVAIVVNRVARARAIFDEVRRRLVSAEQSDEHAALLIGRARAIERDRLLAKLLPRMAAQDRVDGPPLFVVATQCVEAGADLDFDALVTEIAPLDSLRQRFGRLNRTGRDISARAVILASTEQVARNAKPDAIYGDAVRHTWEVLTARCVRRGRGKNAVQEIDFGIEAAHEWLPTGDDLMRCVAPHREAPVLLPAFVQRWACTSPSPVGDPEVSLFLHGPQAGPGDVQIVWRADLVPKEQERWKELVSVCPPSSLESMTLPLWEAAAWLRGMAKGDVPDVELAPDEESADRGAVGWPALRWRGEDDDQTGLIFASQLRPGDVLVVPASWGGCDRWGWAPRLTEPVSDLGAEANRRHRGWDILRLSPELLTVERLAESDGIISSELRREIEVAQTRLEALVDELASCSDAEVQERVSKMSGLPSIWRDWLARGYAAVERDAEGRPLAVVRRVAPEVDQWHTTGDASTEDDRSVYGRVRVTLREHSIGVRNLAEEFARQSGLPEHLVNDVALAAFLHDAGKAQPQFKLWLYRGDEIASARGEPIAKSGARALARGDLPPDARHEVASIWFALAHPRLREASDPELVLWLVGTHHGWGRPFFPPVAWPPAGEAFTADLGDGPVTSLPALPLSDLAGRWIEIRDRLTARYGPWGLARLETVLRLADHRRSEVEQSE